MALGAIGYSIMPRVADVPSYYISLSGVFLMYIALGELQFELWIKQRSIENRDVIIIGYRAISRFAMAIIFSASIAIIG